MKKVFHEFNSSFFEVLVSDFVSVDGSKFQAYYAKDRNSTANKLDGRIKWLNQHVEEWERLKCYEGYWKYMEKNGLPQLSITDSDAKLTKDI